MQSSDFQQFRHLCLECADSLNQQPGYMAEYVRLKGLLITEHDAEYLQLTHRQPDRTIKIHLLWSLAYRQVELYFLVYDQNMKPLSAEAISHKFFQKRQELRAKQEHGIYLTLQPVSQQNMFALHGCQLKLEGKMLISFYLSLFGLYPTL